MILCNAAKAKFPGLKKGERVLMSSFTAEEGKKISEWFENCLFIPIGVLPESKFNDEQFAVPFDMSAEDSKDGADRCFESKKIVRRRQRCGNRSERVKLTR